MLAPRPWSGPFGGRGVVEREARAALAIGFAIVRVSLYLKHHRRVRIGVATGHRGIGPACLVARVECRMPGVALWCVDLGYLVDPASSHMLVSKIKPCMSKYKPLHGETANGSLKQLSSP